MRGLDLLENPPPLRSVWCVMPLDRHHARASFDCGDQLEYLFARSAWLAWSTTQFKAGRCPAHRREECTGRKILFELRRSRAPGCAFASRPGACAIADALKRAK
jgi:hypothetical protein